MRVLQKSDIECLNGLHTRVGWCPNGDEVVGQCDKRIKTDVLRSILQDMKQWVSENQFRDGKEVEITPMQIVQQLDERFALLFKDKEAQE